MENGKRYRLYYSLFLILLLSIIVGFRSFLMLYFIEPIVLLFWTAWRIISSIDQNIYWAMLIVFCAIFITYQLLPGKEAAPRSLYKEKEKSPSRVEHWQRLITDAASGREEVEQLRDSLKELLGNVITDDGQTNGNVDALAVEGQALLPSAVYQFLFLPEKRGGILQDKMMDFAPAWFRRWAIKLSKRDNSKIDETLCWMENELEINNGK